MIFCLEEMSRLEMCSVAQAVLELLIVLPPRPQLLESQSGPTVCCSNSGLGSSLLFLQPLSEVTLFGGQSHVTLAPRIVAVPLFSSFSFLYIHKTDV